MIMGELVDLKICGLTIPEAKEILEKVREVEQRASKRLFFVQLLGLENENLRDAEEVLKQIFPRKDVQEDSKFTVFARGGNR